MCKLTRSNQWSCCLLPHWPQKWAFLPLQRPTSTNTPGHRHIVAVVTLQPFVVVTGSHGAAVLVELCRTHLTAATSIWHQANPRGANPGLCGASTHCWAAGHHLRGAETAISHHHRQPSHQRQLLQGSWRHSPLLSPASSFQPVGINMLAWLKTGGRE